MQYPEYEVIVVDGNSTDQTLEIAREYPVRIFSDEGRGLAYARDIGWRKATGEFVIYFDSDMWTPQTDYIQRFLKYFKDPKVAGVEGTVLCDPKLAKKSLIARLQGYSSVMIAITPVFEREGIGTWGAMFRRSILVKIGGFDKKFKTHAEDTDLSIRIKKFGYLLIHAPEIIAYHLKEYASLKALCKECIIGGYYNGMLKEKHQIIQMRPLKRFLSLKRLKVIYNIFKKTKDPAVFLFIPYQIICRVFKFLGRMSYKKIATLR